MTGSWERGKPNQQVSSVGEGWTSRWLSLIESRGTTARVEAGRRYADSGRVLRVEIRPGAAEAQVQGSRYEPYRVRLRIKRFTERQWEKVTEALASQAGFAARLLGGEMPAALETTLSEMGLALLPDVQRDVRTSCSCPDPAQLCKHAAAFLIALAETLDHDPFGVFFLRGRSRDEILRMLRSRRAREATGRSAADHEARPLARDLERFWRAGESLDSVAVSVGPPVVSAALLKRLGLPSFWKPRPEIRGALERLYAKVTERAMALAYGGVGREPATSRAPDET